RDVLIGGHVIQQPKILRHDSDPLAQVRDLILAEQRNVVAKQVDQATGRPQRKEQQPQQRGLAGSRGAGEKLEGMGGNGETEVAQNLRAEPVAQSDIFEPNQVQLRSVKGATGNPRKPAASARGPGCCREPNERSFASFMVSDSLTVAL